MNPGRYRNVHRGGCGCGLDPSLDRAFAEQGLADPADGRRVLTEAFLRGAFPEAARRRRLLASVGGAAVLATLSSLVPGAAIEALASEKGGPIEKPGLKIGFLPITCATPLVVAHASGHFAAEGLKVDLVKTAGWAVVRDKTLTGEYDAAHMLAPMPLAISLGLGSPGVPMVMPVTENVNGSAITLHVRHRERRDPRHWKGMTLAIPFEYSMHNFLLRHYLAEHGLDPDRDVQLRVMAPPDMVANLSSGNIDGFIVADPFNQRAVYEGVGFIHLLSSELWDGHPCCAFATTADFATRAPNTFGALVRAMIRATRFAQDPARRREIAETIHTPNYLNQPKTVVEQVLTGRFADGLGKVRNAPERIGFDPYPWQSMAVWMLAQMKRWGYLKEDVSYRQVAERVFLATDARRRMAELGLEAPKTAWRTHAIMGRDFDASRLDGGARAAPGGG